ncbi:Ig-like domain-containing protein [Patescibacteria group bacterium]|nr:Ig-like domain-containing protein [Patescibacteria group bacterium]
MTNKLIVLIVIVLTFVVLISAVVFDKKPTPVPLPVPIFQTQPSSAPETTMPSVQPTAEPLQIISSVPEDNDKNIPTNITLWLTFNQNINKSLINTKLTPAAQLKISTNQNMLFVKPIQELLPATSYTLELSSAETSFSQKITFQTAAQNPSDSSLDEKSIKAIEEGTKQAQPAAYLTNKMPYSSDQFEVNWSVRPSPKTLYFVVTLKGSDKANSKNAFVSWLKSLDLTDAQIQGLDIEYQ